MITTNVFQRVFQLKYQDGAGTCFAIDYDNKQYFITAKHVVPNLKNNDTVELFYNSAWKEFSVNLVGQHFTADVCVFVIDIHLPRHIMEPTAGGLTLGQDTYFLGFPFQMRDDENSHLNQNFPIPFVKKAIVSCVQFRKSEGFFYLDGINNPGFSGGPVVFSNNSKDYKVAGIISGYKHSNEPTYLKGKETPLSVQMNTGIILAYSINSAIELIKVNPIGIDLSKR